MSDPFFILACLLALGIVLAQQMSLGLVPWIAGWIVSLFVFFVLIIRRSPRAWICLCLVVVFTGAIRHRAAHQESVSIADGIPNAVLKARVAAVFHAPATGQQPSAANLHKYILDRVQLISSSGAIALPWKVQMTVQSPGHGGVPDSRSPKASLAPVVTVPFVPGDMITVRGTLRGLDARRNPGMWDKEEAAREQGIHARLFMKHPGDVRLCSRGHFSPWEKLLRAVRARWNSSLELPLERGTPGQETLLVKGMILGERGALDVPVQESFQRTNTFHILAISGQQMTLIFIILFGVLCAVGISLKATALISIPLVILYASVVGWQPSVARAALMIILVLIGLAFDRKVRLMRMLGIAACILLLVNPHEIFDVGFQLSFLAVVFLITFTPPLYRGLMHPLERWKNKMSKPTYSAGRGVAALLSASFAAWLATAPVTAWNFQWFTPVTLLANLFIVGWTSVVTIPLGFVCVIAGSLCPELAYPFHAVNVLLTKVLIYMTHALAALPWGSFTVSRPAFSSVVFYYAFFAVLALWIDSSARRRPMLSGSETSQKPSSLPVQTKWKRCLVLSVLAACCLVSQIMFLHRLECVFFDVGQGDAIVVRFPNGKTMLVDGGPAGNQPPFAFVLKSYMRMIGAKQIDYLAMSHPHADHIGGLISVLKEIDVKEMAGNGSVFPSLLFRHVLQLAEKKKIPLSILCGPSRWLNEGGVAVDVVYPAVRQEKIMTRRKKDENDGSIVLALRYAGRCLLLTGDIGNAGQAYFSGLSARLPCDVLKVPHHGGQTSHFRGFLESVTPQRACFPASLSELWAWISAPAKSWAVISVGKANKFGHPAQEVLTLLQQTGWKVYRTDQNGALIVRGYGRWWTLRTMAGSG